MTPDFGFCSCYLTTRGKMATKKTTTRKVLKESMRAQMQTSAQLNLRYIQMISFKPFDNLRNSNILLLPLEKSFILQTFLYGSDNYNHQ